MKSIGLTDRQHRILEATKEKFEEDFGKRITYGEMVLVLCMGFLEGRNVIDREAEYVVINTE